MPRIPGSGRSRVWTTCAAEVLRVAGVPSDEPSFRALDLNLEISQHGEMVCSPLISGPALLMRSPFEDPRMSGSTLAKQVRVLRRWRSGL